MATVSTAPDGTVTVLIPYAELPCLACCMTPDVLCWTVVACGHTYTGRLRRVPPGDGVPEFQWDTCADGGSGVRVIMTCDRATGELTVIVDGGHGDGGPLPVKVPDLWCDGWHVRWDSPGDDLPVFRCGVDSGGHEITEQIASVEITDVPSGSCPACLDGIDGAQTKTIRVEHDPPCPTVCSCCGLVPCRQCLALTVTAPGCDFSGMTITLESVDGGCTWTGTLDPTTVPLSPAPNCPGLLSASATCTDGGWALTFGTTDLLGCDDPVTTHAQCHPLLRVLARMTCTGIAA